MSYQLLFITGAAFFQVLVQLIALLSFGSSVGSVDALGSIFILSLFGALFALRARKLSELFNSLTITSGLLLLIQLALLLVGFQFPIAPNLLYTLLISVLTGLAIIAPTGLRKYFRPLNIGNRLQDLFLLCAVTFWTWSSVSDSLLVWCRDRIRLDFDAQNFIVWLYTASRGMIPYRDVSYWYGILSYVKDSQPVFYLISLFWVLLLFILWYVVLRVVLKNQILALIGWYFCLTIVNSMSGLASLYRYGSTGVVMGCAALAMSGKYWRPAAIITGMIVSIFVMAFLDQGIYSLILISGLIVFMGWKNGWRSGLELGSRFALGLLLGFIPLAYWLFSHQAGNEFVAAVQSLGSIGVFAKVPFGDQIRTPGDIVITIAIWILAIDLTFLWWDRRRKFTPIDALKLIWLGSMLIFQYKNIVRKGMEFQFIYLALGSILLYLSPLFDRLKSAGKAISLGAGATVIFGLFLAIVALRPDARPALVFERFIRIARHPDELTVSVSDLSKKIAICSRESLAAVPSLVPPEYQQVRRWIWENGPGKVFAFPSDPIFYLLFDQPPAPVFNGYDASLFSVQRALISHLKSENVEYVILSTSKHGLQDGVPNELRNPLMYSYIFREYCPVQSQGAFLILQRKGEKLSCRAGDFFDPDSIVPKDYRDYLLSTQLGSLPLLAGKLNGSTNEAYRFAQSTDQIPVGQLIDGPAVLSLIIEGEAAPLPKIMTVQLNFRDGLTSTASFTTCPSGRVCNLDLSLLPVSYFPQQLDSFQFTASFSGTVKWNLSSSADIDNH